jgi:hypothetical protein
MGFMGSMPIAGVIWQHIHYIVGLQRLGLTFTTSKIRRVSRTARTFEITDEFAYAAKVLERLAREFEFKRRWGYCARYLPGNPTAGLSLNRIRQLYREADAILNVCGARSSMTICSCRSILYIESDPGVEQIKVDKNVKSTIEYLRRHRGAFYLRRKHRDKKLSRAHTRIQLAANPATGGD